MRESVFDAKNDAADAKFSTYRYIIESGTHIFNK
jgi:hypothetical protein